MSLLVVGISHKTAPVRVRERFSFTRKHLEESLRRLKDSGCAAGAVILSTCNRTEVYLEDCDSPHPGPPPEGEGRRGAGRIKEFMFEIFNAPEGARRYFYALEEVDAVRHLFRVASGLESQVLGENQIMGQVRSAWNIAKDALASTPELDGIFVAALKTGGLVRTQTKISYGNTSIGSVAIRMIEEKTGNLENHSVLIIGAGKIGALISSYLREKKIKGIFVASRTYARAVRLAAGCGGRAVGFDRLQEELEGIDIVISSTSSPHVILKKEMLERLMRERSAPLLIMDLAVPHDVDPDAGNIPGISLYDLDDMKSVVEENYRMREQEAHSAQMLVEKQLEKYRASVITGEHIDGLDGRDGILCNDGAGGTAVISP